MAITTKASAPNPYRANPSVLTALRSPRILTREVLAGLVVAMTLIPEAISFSIIAGVDPRVGLFSSFVMAVSIAFLGGRPAMITAATGAIALVIAPAARRPRIRNKLLHRHSDPRRNLPNHPRPRRSG